MRYIVFILVGVTLTGCASVLQVSYQDAEWPNSTEPPVSTTAGKGKIGQRIFIGLGIGAVLGAVAGAAVVQEMNEEAFFKNDDSRTDPLMGAAVGSVVGAGVGALVAAITASKNKRGLPPWIPDRSTSDLTLYRDDSNLQDPRLLPQLRVFPARTSTIFVSTATTVVHDQTR